MARAARKVRPSRRRPALRAVAPPPPPAPDVACIEALNLGLVLGAAALAWVLPFQLLLPSYAVLGPLLESRSRWGRATLAAYVVCAIGLLVHHPPAANWAPSVGLYAWDYRTGLVTLFVLSLAHVLLELPLDLRTIVGLGADLRPARAALVVLALGGSGCALVARDHACWPFVDHQYHGKVPAELTRILAHEHGTKREIGSHRAPMGFYWRKRGQPSLDVTEVRTLAGSYELAPCPHAPLHPTTAALR